VALLRRETCNLRHPMHVRKSTYSICTLFHVLVRVCLLTYTHPHHGFNLRLKKKRTAKFFINCRVRLIPIAGVLGGVRDGFLAEFSTTRRGVRDCSWMAEECSTCWGVGGKMRFLNFELDTAVKVSLNCPCVCCSVYYSVCCSVCCSACWAGYGS